MNKVLKLVINLNLIEAVDAAAVVIFTFLLTSEELKLFPLISAFFSTLFLYSLNRKSDLREDRINVPDRFNFWSRYGNKIIFLTLISFVIVIFFNFFIGFYQGIFLLLPFFIVFSYSFLRLKNILFLKNIIVAAGWSLIPLYASTYMVSPSLSLIFFCASVVFLSILINTIVFDVRDIVGDKIVGVRTIPSVHGILFSKKLAYFLNVVLLFFIISAIFVFKVVSVNFSYLLFFPLFIGLYISILNQMNAYILSEYIANLDMIILLLLCIVSKL
jgi:4-hydroxybenzoate polyprenyltransferase